MTKEEFNTKWKTIRPLIMPIGDALYRCNEADTTGSLINSSIASEPFNLINQAWQRIVALTYGEKYINVDWGSCGGGTYYQDIKESCEYAFCNKTQVSGS